MDEINKKIVVVENTLRTRKFLELTNKNRSAKIIKLIADIYNDQLRTAYRENLEYVLNELSKLT